MPPLNAPVSRMREEDVFDRAVAQIGVRRVFRKDGRTIPIACLIRTEDWRPLEADWWQGKEVYIIGADLEGNFFLRHCDGTVRYWLHQSERDEILADSVRDFVRGISE